MAVPQPNCQPPVLCMLPLDTTTPLRTAPHAPPCRRPRTSVSFIPPMQTLLTFRSHCPRPPSPTRSGRHYTGTSGKPKTSSTYPRQWNTAPTHKTQCPLSIAQPAHPRPVAYDPKPPFKCTSPPSTRADRPPKLPPTATSRPPSPATNHNHQRRFPHPATPRLHRLNHLTHAGQRPTSCNTSSNGTQPHSSAHTTPHRPQ